MKVVKRMISETEKGIDPVLEVLPEGEVSLLDLLVLLVEKKRFILLFTLGVSALTAVVCMILPLRYTGEKFSYAATAVLRWLRNALRSWWEGEEARSPLLLRLQPRYPRVRMTRI